MRTISKADLRSFLRARTTGAIDGAVKKVSEVAKRQVAGDTAGADISWLAMVLKFVVRERDPQLVLRENPIADFQEVEKNPNPRQPVCSWERFVKITEAADRVTWKVW